MISLGAKSPPIASRAMGRVNLVDLYGDAILVPATVGAHDVGQFGGRALRADAARRARPGSSWPHGGCGSWLCWSCASGRPSIFAFN